MKASETLLTMTYEKGNLESRELLTLYENMLHSRLIEEKMLTLLRQGKISKWFSGIGQEAISVGVTLALKDDEYILPMHRNLGVFVSRRIPLFRLFTQWQGKATGFTKGRDRSFHFGTQEYKIIGMISHLGPQLGVADGIALAHKLRKEQSVTAVFTGEGATSEGDFHEALNVAAVWDLPVIFCIENNGYGLSTPTSEQYRCENLADKGKGYGIESHIIEGNNVLEVYGKVKELAESMRKNPRPVLLEFKTFRMRGHEEASGVAYVPESYFETWEKKDPIQNYRNYLLQIGLITEEGDQELQQQLREDINTQVQQAFAEPAIAFDREKELADVYVPHQQELVKPGEATEELRFVDAISQGLKQSMEQFPDLVLMGQDIAEYGGVFKITQGFVEAFGKDRVRNTPICESAIVSAAMGLSINGMRAMVEMQFADFVSSGFNPIVNYLAKTHYRWGEPAKVVVRMPCGAGVGAGPFHSQTNEAWFLKVPGLKVVYPAFPADAKGLLTASIEDPNPVIFFEHKALYRSVRQEVPVDYYTLPIGKASTLAEGDQLTIIAWGAAVHWALEVLDKHPGISATLIDLRSLQPLDTEAIAQAVKRTGKVLIVHEDTLGSGFGAEISSWIMENCFEYLDAPVKRVGSMDTPVPFAKVLEQEFLAKSVLEESVLALLNY